jgi:predicted transcriptional regulator
MTVNNNLVLMKLSTKIVSSFITNNSCAPEEILDLFKNIYLGLQSIEDRDRVKSHQSLPAVPIEESIQNEKIICLEDGKSFKMLKRHLASNYNMTPEQYRKKWNLPIDYPMVAPAYSKQRQKLAKAIGLGKVK